MRFVDLKWVNLLALIVVIRGPNFTKCSFFDAGENVVNSAVYCLSILRFVLKIFTVKIRS